MRKENEINDKLWGVRVFIFMICTLLSYSYFHFPEVNLGVCVFVGGVGLAMTVLISRLLHHAIILEKRWFLFEKGVVLIPHPSYLPAGIYHVMVSYTSRNKVEVILQMAAVNIKIIDDETNTVSLGNSNRMGYSFTAKSWDDGISAALQQEGDVSIIVNLEWSGVVPKLTLHGQSAKLISLVN